MRIELNHVKQGSIAGLRLEVLVGNITPTFGADDLDRELSNELGLKASARLGRGTFPGPHWVWDWREGHFFLADYFFGQKDGDEWLDATRRVVDRLTNEVDNKKLRRRIEDALRKTASKDDLLAVAGMLNVKI